MKRRIIYYARPLLAGALFLIFAPVAVMAQFTAQWLDIGTLHSRWTESGAQREVAAAVSNHGMEWPAKLRQSTHFIARGLWAGHQRLDRCKWDKSSILCCPYWS